MIFFKLVVAYFFWATLYIRTTVWRSCTAVDIWSLIFMLQSHARRLISEYEEE